MENLKQELKDLREYANHQNSIINKLNDVVENLNKDMEFKNNVIKELQMEIFKLLDENTSLINKLEELDIQKEINKELRETIKLMRGHY